MRSNETRVFDPTSRVWTSKAPYSGTARDHITFPTSGTHTLRIQIREDGVQLDQIVLSSTTYLNTPPGPVTNDNTIVAK